MLKQHSSFHSLPIWIAGLISIMSLLSCAPTVKVTTPEPLKVDIAMKVDVYQRDSTTPVQHKLDKEEIQALRRRDDRSNEIWLMKNDGVVAETKNGYLEAKDKVGWDPNYVHRLVAEENQDRRILYQAEAIQSSRPLETVEMEAGQRFQTQISGTITNGVMPSATH